MFNVETFMDLSGSLAILAMLAIAYGALHRVLPDKRLFEPLMGVFFGLVALVQMHSPIEPAPGFLIDMRNVPVILAGAFLGGRGLLPCLVIAIVARWHAGGVGAVPGIMGLVVAGSVGLVWAGVFARRTVGPVPLLALGVFGSLHMLGAVLLPLNLAIWFLTEAAPVLFVLNLLSIPTIGGLLERERRRIRREVTLERNADFTLGAGLMGEAAFAWSLGQAAATGTLHDGGTVIALRIRFQGALARFWGQHADHLAMTVFHDRLKAVMPKGGLVGWAEEDLVLMALPRLGAERTRELLTQIRRDVSSTPIALPGMAPFRLVLDLDARHFDVVPALHVLVAEMSPVGMPRLDARPTRPQGADQKIDRKLVAVRRADRALRVEGRPGPVGDLFATFDQLRQDRFGVTGSSV